MITSLLLNQSTIQFMKVIKNCLLFIFLSILLAACGLLDKDNTPQPTPLTTFPQQIKPLRLWVTKTGGGSTDDYLKMTPAVGDQAIYTASTRGIVTAINKNTGQIIWQRDTYIPIVSGPGIGADILIVGSRKVDIVALQQADGKERWRMIVPGEILAPPAISNDTAIIKTVDGTVRAFSLK